ncbi:MAG: S8 family serine peptidase [Acidobacteria bacterium]|nr:S8 family serine peptidase [Acidobacteriota bacterium]
MTIRKKIAAAAILALVGLLSASVDAQTSRRWVENEVLIKFRDNADSAIARAANRIAGVERIETLGDVRWERVRLRPGQTVEQAVAELPRIQGVEAVQPNFYYHLAVTPNDPQFSSGGMYGLTKISAPAAWDLSTGSSSVVVADIDTGLRYTHQDLAQNAWMNPGELPTNGVDDDGNGFIDDVYGWDFFYNDSNPYDDAGGHGTHTAGTIGAVGNNLLNVAGVNWSVKIMAIKIYSPNGTDSTSAMLVNAYAYIRMMKLRGVNIRATNNSYGDCGEACGYDQATKDGIDAMGDAGIVNVFAAGNDSQNVDSFPAGGNPSPGYPVRYTSPSIIGVASSNSSDTKSGFSNWGTTSIDLAAPGSGILSTYASSDTATTTMSGTSMATPHVTGAVALLAAYHPELSVASLKATILNTVDVLPAWAAYVKTSGRLNVFHALQNPTVCTFTPSITEIRVPTKGKVFDVTVTAPTNCEYSITPSSNWIKILTSKTASGTATVTIRVPVNPTISRTGTVTFGDQSLTITQHRN